MKVNPFLGRKEGARPPKQPKEKQGRIEASLDFQLLVFAEVSKSIRRHGRFLNPLASIRVSYLRRAIWALCVRLPLAAPRYRAVLSSIYSWARAKNEGAQLRRADAERGNLAAEPFDHGGLVGVESIAAVGNNAHYRLKIRKSAAEGG